MRAISLWQPWASAVPLGFKLIETRHWSTTYRGPLAIHAAIRWTKDQREFASIEHSLGRLPARIPRGAIVAVLDLVDVVPTHELLATGRVNPIERIYGDYADGRFGWMFDNVRALPKPIPFTGRQGFFNVPDELVAAAFQEAA